MRWQAWARLPVVGRFTLIGFTALGAAGAVAGLIVGLLVHPVTAPFAAIEVGLPAGLLGALAGATGGTVMWLARKQRGTRL